MGSLQRTYSIFVLFLWCDVRRTPDSFVVMRVVTADCIPRRQEHGPQGYSRAIRELCSFVSLPCNSDVAEYKSLFRLWSLMNEWMKIVFTASGDCLLFMNASKLFPSMSRTQNVVFHLSIAPTVYYLVCHHFGIDAERNRHTPVVGMRRGHLTLHQLFGSHAVRMRSS